MPALGSAKNGVWQVVKEHFCQPPCCTYVESILFTINPGFTYWAINKQQWGFIWLYLSTC